MFFIASTYKEGVGFVSDSHGGGSDSIIAFHVWQSSLLLRGCCFTLGDSLLVVNNMRRVWEIPWDVSDEALLLKF